MQDQWSGDGDRVGPPSPPPLHLSSRARLVIPVILSLVVQIPPNLWWLTQLRELASVLTIALAIIGPLALLLVRRIPGPVVAFVSVAACIDTSTG
ncbi:hypothetical protein GCM10007382_03220 [Salinibacterium xinjiangense]|uniref:Uncharacterized protein n=2 Tax=Salinibacterium xinjiangense TaxID=386302 RepID=A0A2C8ZML8_9MICO|nr:hypothetical protein GCM10007382_03220 [Salinibacterium xinjiangense]SOE66369.1 hypothetical protein SAMN06296378_1721 [Salinibacterium xinjiangense]